MSGPGLARDWPVRADMQVFPAHAGMRNAPAQRQQSGAGSLNRVSGNDAAAQSGRACRCDGGHQVDVSVVVPSYRRCEDLDRCLRALARQRRRADEVIVVARADDIPTLRLLSGWLDRMALHGLRVATVAVPGQVAANNRGLDSARGDILCLTDDDAAPRADWIERIVAHFRIDSGLAGVGGRDIVHDDDGGVIAGAERDVGLLRWYGRIVGNHHIGSGEPRTVDILKGVNMAWRRSAVAGLRFDSRLRGAGAQVHNDLAFCLAARRRGARLLYDPGLCVDHYPALRADADQRASFNPESFYNASYNLHLALGDHLRGVRGALAQAYLLLAGSSNCPGALRALLLGFGPDGPARAWQKLRLGLRAGHAARTARMVRCGAHAFEDTERAETDGHGAPNPLLLHHDATQQPSQQVAEKEKLPW